MGKGSSNSKHKHKQHKDAQSDPIALSKKRWSDWSNLALGAAAMTSTALYVWRKIQASQIDQAGKETPSAAGAQSGPDMASDTPRSMTAGLSSNWGKTEQASDAPPSGRDTPVH
ncbi:MAG: hypothetical protein RLZZ561_1732 [Pseudomonadota bacterium]|jgi:cytoskeletal protein RodZ